MPAPTAAPPTPCHTLAATQVTQCLAAASANEWYLAVAKPSEHGPRVSDLSVFQIPVSESSANAFPACPLG